ncbi:hypothetical protein ASZ90_016342 [hydrocarbon metagenome]|uniref:Uncharacterized protein n=1 Tax=hydrocarbon metagenome TaxID=938273 RepID=A0A0W8EYK8_9ZZZZ
MSPAGSRRRAGSVVVAKGGESESGKGVAAGARGAAAT